MMAYVYQPYPKVLYREVQIFGGRFETQECLVHSEVEHTNRGRLWAESPELATAARIALEDEVSEAAAERGRKDQSMSKKAQRDMDKREAKTGKHVPE